MTAPLTSQKSLALVVNPTAGRGAAGRALAAINRLSSERFDQPVRFFVTQRSGDGERLALEALAEGAEIVAAVGGDGTLHEVANALQSSTVSRSASLALIPFGTGNDFARAVNLRGTLASVIDAIAAGERRMIDVGIIESPSLPAPRRFLVAAGIGFVADTAHTVNTQIKFLTGPAAYVYGACKTLKLFQPVKARLSFDGGETAASELSLVSVSNVATTGGGIRIAPDASPSDGLFDVCLVESLPKFQLITKLPLAFQGRHIHDASVKMIRCAQLEIETETPCALWIDGEVTGTTPVTFRIQPAALPMMLPREATAHAARTTDAAL